MSTLTPAEKLYFEKLLGMSTGYVLNFTDATFGEAFSRHGIDIHGPKYQTYGTSKARKMRSFWEQEPDNVSGPILSEMLERYEATCHLEGKEAENENLEKCRQITNRLLGKGLKRDTEVESEFLELDFEIPDFNNLPVEYAVAEIIRNRLEEAQSCMNAKAYLAVILLCGSVLEAVLLGAAREDPERFNRSPVSPKKDNKVKLFPDWRLSELIDVAHNVGVLKLDVQKFSHGLRDFRNYIHPYEQMASGFTPDEYTAKVSFQVLRAALASVAGER